MVSFIHKSIQEYLAAWYLIYSCVPNGKFSEIRQHAATLENCVVLKNVFQFVCGLSDESAVKVLEHLKSVRISDPTLDLSKTIPDIETETEVPLCDFTDRHERFGNLIHDSFREVQSKGELLSYFLDCTGGIVRATGKRPLHQLMESVNVLIELAHNCVFSFIDDKFHGFFYMPDIHDECVEDSVLYKSPDFLNCLQTPLRVTENSDVVTVEDFIRSRYTFKCCLFPSILCFRNGQFQMYITKLFLVCGFHAGLFTESTRISVPSDAARLCSEQSCLKFLSSLGCRRLSSKTVKGLGAIIGNCKHLSRIKVQGWYDSICYLLEQVRNSSKCCLTINSASPFTSGYGVHLTSVGAVQLASLLTRFINVIALDVDLSDCCAAAQDKLVTSITHKTLKQLILRGIILTPAATKALGRSLPEMSSLKELHLIGVDGSILQAEKMETLFSGFNKTMPLYQLTFKDFSGKDCLSPLINVVC